MLHCLLDSPRRYSKLSKCQPRMGSRHVLIFYVCVDACRLRARRCIRAETFECSEFVDLEGATNDTEFQLFLRTAC